MKNTIAWNKMFLVLNHGEPIKIKAKYAGNFKKYKVLESLSRVKHIDNAFKIGLEGAKLSGVQIL